MYHYSIGRDPVDFTVFVEFESTMRSGVVAMIFRDHEISLCSGICFGLVVEPDAPQDLALRTCGEQMMCSGRSFEVTASARGALARLWVVKSGAP
jgi:hypothetical protein